MSAPYRSRLLTGTPVEEHGLLFPTPWIRVPVAAAGDTATLTAVGVTVGLPAVTGIGEVNATATLTPVGLAVALPAVAALSGVIVTLTAVLLTIGVPAVAATGDVAYESWGMIPIGVA